MYGCRCQRGDCSGCVCNQRRQLCTTSCTWSSSNTCKNAMANQALIDALTTLTSQMMMNQQAQQQAQQQLHADWQLKRRRFNSSNKPIKRYWLSLLIYLLLHQPWDLVRQPLVSSQFIREMQSTVWLTGFLYSTALQWQKDGMTMWNVKWRLENCLVRHLNGTIWVKTSMRSGPSWLAALEATFWSRFLWWIGAHKLRGVFNLKRIWQEVVS